ncbi:MAG: M48 family metallopeptidase, partial [Bacteroidota bacterium]
DRYIRREIKAVRIKDNSSNWGSCSSTGNINIAARTLLTPLWVQDYICVHELAHLVELNHSAQYWSIVAGILPNYGEAERWLKTDGPSCKF